MKLYHFTAEEYVEEIKTHGILLGDVPTSPLDGFNAPWLTSDPFWQNQGWREGSTINKVAVRLTIEIPDEELEKKLFYWPKVAKMLNMSKEWYWALDEAGGRGSSKWYIHLGTIPPERIKKIEYNNKKKEKKGN